jgi:RHS repeat-associated protein
VNYLYDGESIIAELDGSGNQIARYAHGFTDDEPFAEVRSGTTAFYQQDGLGSVTSLSSLTGTLSNSYTYDSFGNLTASTGSLINPFQYAARDYDPETGLKYYRARYYDSTAGGFLSEDPARFWAGVNFYEYVDNSPINEFDPSGLEPPDKNDLARRVICNKPCADYLGGLTNVLRAIAKTRYIDVSDPRSTVPATIRKKFADNPKVGAYTQIGGNATYYRPPPEGYVLDWIVFLHELRHIQGLGAEIDKDYETEYATIKRLCQPTEIPTITPPTPPIAPEPIK